jgi:hypothetical protein
MKLLELPPRTYPNCEDCNCELDHTRIVYTKRLIKPYPHWSKQCQTCKCYQSPLTGEFNLTNLELRHYHILEAGLKIPKQHQHGGPGRPPGAKNKPKTTLIDK